MSGEDDAGEEESRSDRLRRRRSQRQQTAADAQSRENESENGESAELDEPSEKSEPSKPSKPSERSEPDEPGSVKTEQVGTYMYLPKTQKKKLGRLYNVLKAEYEYEYDADFEKNRHFYPLVIQYGLEDLDGLDASEIRERLDSINH